MKYFYKIKKRTLARCSTVFTSRMICRLLKSAFQERLCSTLAADCCSGRLSSREACCSVSTSMPMKGRIEPSTDLTGSECDWAVICVRTFSEYCRRRRHCSLRLLSAW